MSNIEMIIKDGFQIPGPSKYLTRMALYSLRIAIKAYSSTYQSLKSKLHYFEMNPGETNDQYLGAYNNNYYINCAESIIHFQHFFELVIKDILREEHILLANDASNYPIILKRLLKNENINDLDIEKTKSVEFSEALKRIILLIDTEVLGNGNYDFISESKEIFDNLNTLRNRIWHRGTFLLHYPSLDLFIGEYILPLAMKFTSLYPYNEFKSYWIYKKLDNDFCPLNSLLNSFEKEKYNINKIAILKEMIRSAYNNPVLKVIKANSKSTGLIVNFENYSQKRAEHLAKSIERFEYNIDNIKKCPICGTMSLISFNEMEADIDEEGNILKQWQYVYNVKCLCCSFELFKEVGNPQIYELPLDNYFTTIILDN
ncbi:MAG: hypothetical protein NTV87_12635 [Ignavibacteriae bacterium]|nr:hypothetical protein [Ignavibacteriota bacterium]